MSEEYIPAIITASVALLAAVGAQFLAHYLQNKRICKEKDNKAYQELIFPFLSKILIFYETETNFRKGHDVEKTVNTDDLINEISKKIQYSDIELLTRYSILVESEYFYDAKGDVKEINTLRFFYAYLSYSLKVMEKNDSKKTALIKQMNRVRIKCGIWILVAEQIGYESSIEVMSFDFLIPNKFYCKSLERSLNKLVYYEGVTSGLKNGRQILESFLEIINREVGGISKDGALAELKYSLLNN